jgi:flagellar biosynthesis/type III secretory pathway M-ring protein FliF/YscJ
VGAGAQSSGGGNQSGSGGSSTITEEETVETEYLVSKTTSEKVEKGAVIKALSVSAFIDSEDGGGGGKASGPPRKELEKVIKNAVGFQESRDDSLTIVRTDLREPSPAAVPQKTEVIPDYVARFAPYGALALAGIVALVAARRLIRGLSEEEGGVPEPAVEQTVPAGDERTRPQAMWRQVCQHARNDPEAAGRLLEAWIHEEE